MPELIPSTAIDDVVLVRPDVHGDQRGRFVETYRRSWFPVGREMVQGNRSEKQAGALVGLHYHLHQADYWYAAAGPGAGGAARPARGSPTDGATEVIDLDGDVDQGIFIPPGVAHGFAALTDVLLCTWSTLLRPGGRARPGLGRSGVGADWGVSRSRALRARPDESAARRHRGRPAPPAGP